LWVTAPLYAVLLLVIGIDLRAVVFWARVGGSVGASVSLAAGCVAVACLLLLGSDLRRQVSFGRVPEGGGGDWAEGPVSGSGDDAR
jgi:hypothetical protein